MSIVFPVTIMTGPLIQGHSEALEPLTIGSNTDPGMSPKIRKRYSGTMRILRVEYAPLTQSQKADLDTFYVAHCADLFDYILPSSGALVSAKFVPGSKPSYTPLSDTFWKASIDLRIDP